eukprot:gnl/Hemi2/28471_TR9421_c0_g1_i1.p1 gnl/Hemi2/28471_TR9421_c0_g1~~gnl/Hemi2/28471_TR9421_c0_g1_i1.p1  ORF type:complete len:314 (+),score=73.28 gnl/Hemi2/28471_TR9421_c0_g1_i1:42-983(+)
MGLYTVYHETVVRVHKASFCSWAAIFAGVVFVLLILCPLVFVAVTPNWIPKENWVRAQPSVTFTNQMIYMLETTASGTNTQYQYSTWTSYTSFSGGTLKAPTSTLTVPVDTNGDGVTDYINIAITVSASTIYHARCVLFFNYTVSSGNVGETMITPIYFDVASPINGAQLYIEGDMKFRQLNALPGSAVKTVYNVQPFNSSSFVDSYTASFPNIISTIFSRDDFTKFDNVYSSWVAGSSATTSFVINATIHTGPDQYYYSPTFVEAWKQAWGQFATHFLIGYVIFSALKRFAFTQQMVQTRQYDPRGGPHKYS